MAAEKIDIPLIIGGWEIRTGQLRAGGDAARPPPRARRLARRRAEARASRRSPPRRRRAREWAAWALDERAAVFLRAAELLTTTWRATLNAATMLGQSKTVFQAEIDAASELIDFWRFNPHFARSSTPSSRSARTACGTALEYRPLEGFVYAVTPFNFTSIAGNLPTAPALMGNTVVWKPAASAILSGYYIMRLLEAAGLPPGVINFVPGDPVQISDIAARLARSGRRPLHRQHAPSSTACGRRSATTSAATEAIRAWSARPAARTSSSRIRPRRCDELAVAIARGGFEYQGQKCSAASRIYVPESLWPGVRDRVVAMMREMKMGDVRDFRHFIGAVIDRKAFDKITRLPRRRAAQRDRSSRAAARTTNAASSSSRRSFETTRSGLPADARGDLRAGGDGLRLSGRDSGTTRCG